MTRTAHVRFLRAFVFALVACLHLHTGAQAQPGARPATAPSLPDLRVLVVFGCQPLQPVCADNLAAIAEEVAAPRWQPAELYVEHLDVARLGAPQDAALVARHLMAKYASRPPTVLVADGDDAVRLLIGHSDWLWTTAPRVAFGVRSPAPADARTVQLKPREAAYRPAETIAAALRMLPGTRRVVYVGGAGQLDMVGRTIFLGQMRQKLPDMPVQQITGLSLAETLRQVAALPADAIVYTVGIFVDGDGRRYVGQASADRIIAAANRPVFVLARRAIGSGAVGGILTDFGAEAREAVRTALQLVRGGPTGPVVASIAHTAPVFDWRQLRRWGIDEAQLPAGSVVLYREPSFLDRYRGWIALAGLQLALIAILLVERGQRVRASNAAVASESLNRSVIASLSGRIAVLDALGTILQVNETWGPLTLDDPGTPLAGAAPGTNVRAAWPSRDQDNTTPPLLDAIEAVLLGHAPERTLEFAHTVGDDPHFFRWIVRALDRPEGGAIVSLVDVTDRKRAELERRRSLQEMAHAARVVTLGELTASLAHEINQPLGAILANAESGEWVLASPSPDLPLLGEILRDITTSSERAGEVIRRMRAMLRKGESVRVAVDVNGLVHDVLTLFMPEAQLRRVALQSDLADDVPPVLGDPVQLQQVLLNLLVNALDATGDDPSRAHAVLVRTRRVGDAVELAVEDDGPGVQPDQMARLFEPFFTTKATGLGIGLAIIRSIVEAHGGTIAAVRNDGPGMTFRCRLPAA